jgi:hypothetical protein
MTTAAFARPRNDTVACTLTAACLDLDMALTRISPRSWQTPTGSAGWRVAHHVAYLTWGDSRALWAITCMDSYLADLRSRPGSVQSRISRAVRNAATERPATLLRRWRRSRMGLARALARRETQPERPGPRLALADLASARLTDVTEHALLMVSALTPDVAAPKQANLGQPTRIAPHLVSQGRHC